MSALRHVLVVLPLTFSLIAAGCCASRKMIDPSSTESIVAAVDKGDEVRIVTRNDVVHRFEVTKITNKALYGPRDRIVYEDIQTIEVTRRSGAKDDDEGGSGWGWLPFVD